MRYALVLARRELRGGIAGFRVFVAALALGVGAIAAVASLDAAVRAGLHGQARALLGGDVAARLAFRPADAAEREFLAASGRLSEIVTLRSMARSGDGAQQSLIELKAVDAAYPLAGAVRLSPAQPLAAALDERDGVFGAAVEAPVASRLGLALGDRFRIGEAELQLRALIEREPDLEGGGLVFGPAVLIATAALDRTRLIRPGAIVAYDYRLLLPPGADPAQWIAAAKARFPEAGWRLRSAAEASPALQRFLSRIGLFLSLVGVTTLLVGGIGIGNAVAGFVAGKSETIATLKCLGAPTRLIFLACLAQVLAFALVAIAAALVFGALAPPLAAPLLARLLPVSLPPGPYPLALAEAAAAGLLATLAFSLIPLAAVGRIVPGALFRDAIAPAPRRPAPAAVAATALAAVGLAGLVVATAADRATALWYVAGIAAAFAAFRLLGGAVAAAARRLARVRRIAARPILRLALANLGRPGAPTGRAVMSLGIGLSVLAAVALVEGNLAAAIDARLAEGAPADFVIDIQPGQLAGFLATIAAVPGIRVETVPMLRGRITRLNGVPVERAKIAPEAQWAVRGDRGLTYAARPPDGAELTAGAWWPAGYRGPPLISFDEALARGMGLGVGDTLTVNLLGREITGRIANLRHIEWARLGINFAIVFAPGTLEAAPQTHLAAVYGDDAAAETALRRAGARFPNITAIPVREALARIERVVAAIATALRLVGLVTLAAGMLVLGGAIAAGHRRRVYEAVVLKVLGATRGTVALAFLVEHGLVGAAAAVAAALVGSVAAYAVVTGPMRSDWVFLAAPLAATLALALAIALGLGFAGTWRALGARPAPLLRRD